MANSILKLLSVAEKLKCNLRHSYTTSGRIESIAEHSWRLVFLCLLNKQEALRYRLDFDRILQMCILHDIGEAIIGDVPSFDKTADDEEAEVEVVKKLFFDTLESSQAQDFWSVYLESSEVKTQEAIFFKALDKMEAVIQHNEADVSTWLDKEFDLLIDYGVEEASGFNQLKLLRSEIQEITRGKRK